MQGNWLPDHREVSQRRVTRALGQWVEVELGVNYCSGPMWT